MNTNLETPGASAGERHDPILASTGGHGCWTTCSCGWTSRRFVNVHGAHLAFGDHLIEISDHRLIHGTGDHQTPRGILTAADLPAPRWLDTNANTEKPPLRELRDQEDQG